jgi:drug/metabolite transporter (DMT)-like permease
MYYDLELAGLFNALDFLASNTSFSHSAASFVETIKASEPITTTAIALIDKLRFPEAVSLGVLVSGVLCSTFGNTSDAVDTTTGNNEDGVQQPPFAVDNEPPNLHESIKT